MDSTVTTGPNPGQTWVDENAMPGMIGQADGIVHLLSLCLGRTDNMIGPRSKEARQFVGDDTNLVSKLESGLRHILLQVQELSERLGDIEAKF